MNRKINSTYLGKDRSQSYQPFFFVKQRFFPFFDFKLGNFKAQTIFYHALNTQAYQQK